MDDSRAAQTVAVVGAGFMGWQIALQAAKHGYRVQLGDVSEDALRRAESAQGAALECSERQTVMDRLTHHVSLSETVANAAIVVEAAPERLDLKQELFRQLDALCPSDVLLATNSSSLRVAALEVGLHHKERLLNMHFFGYIPDRPMAELMGGSATSEKVMDQARAFVRSIGLTPLMVRKQSTGFLFNRVWRAVKKECLRVADDGVASVQDIDRAWMIFNRAPMGPFGLMDMIGLDVIRDIELVYFRESGDPSDAPPRILLDAIERGDLGVKTGKGFYEYPDAEFMKQEFLRG